MADLNRANRSCCNLDIRKYLKGGISGDPWMDADFCNSTTYGFEGDNSYGKKRGANYIAFANPITGTISLTFQCHPFKIYSILSDGKIETSAVITKKETIKCATAGKLTITGVPVAGTVFVYADGDFGGLKIEGTFATGAFTATQPTSIAVDSTYVVGYMESKTTGVRNIQFNDAKIPGYYRIQMETVDKDENGDLIPVLFTGYKCSPQRKLDLSFSDEGDVADITITFDCLKDDMDNVLSMTEISE